MCDYKPEKKQNHKNIQISGEYCWLIHLKAAIKSLFVLELPKILLFDDGQSAQRPCILLSTNHGHAVRRDWLASHAVVAND